MVSSLLLGFLGQKERMGPSPGERLCYGECSLVVSLQLQVWKDRQALQGAFLSLECSPHVFL